MVAMAAYIHNLLRQVRGVSKYNCCVNKARGRVVFEDNGNALWGCVVFEDNGNALWGCVQIEA